MLMHVAQIGNMHKVLTYNTDVHIRLFPFGGQGTTHIEIIA